MTKTLFKGILPDLSGEKIRRIGEKNYIVVELVYFKGAVPKIAYCPIEVDEFTTDFFSLNTTELKTFSK